MKAKKIKNATITMECSEIYGGHTFYVSSNFCKNAQFGTLEEVNNFINYCTFYQKNGVNYITQKTIAFWRI